MKGVAQDVIRMMSGLVDSHMSMTYPWTENR